MEGLSPRTGEAGEQDHEDPITVAEHGPLDGSTDDDELVPQLRVLGEKLRFGWSDRDSHRIEGRSARQAGVGRALQVPGILGG